MGLTERQQEIVDRIREEAPGDIIRIEPDIIGFLVVQELPEASSPTLYRVTLEKQIDESEPLHWNLLGPVSRTESERDDTHHPL